VAPLTHLVQKDQPFASRVETKIIFLSLKTSFTTTPLLTHVDISKPFILETDAFDFALGIMISQHGKKCFSSCQFSFSFSLTKINSYIHNKKLK
jgi:hypothetical protein